MQLRFIFDSAHPDVIYQIVAQPADVQALAVQLVCTVVGGPPAPPGSRTFASRLYMWLVALGLIRVPAGEIEFPCIVRIEQSVSTQTRCLAVTYHSPPYGQ
jgi:hypothetical protein